MDWALAASAVSTCLVHTLRIVSVHTPDDIATKSPTCLSRFDARISVQMPTIEGLRMPPPSCFYSPSKDGDCPRGWMSGRRGKSSSWMDERRGEERRRGGGEERRGRMRAGYTKLRSHNWESSAELNTHWFHHHGCAVSLSIPLYVRP